MKSTIAKVFLIIGVLVLCLLVWALFFNGGGILENGWNGMANQINATWQKITGTTDDVVPNWNTGANNVSDAIDNAETGGGGGGSGPVGP